jgi:molybdate transport repressor ModE-like protein/molybdopterin-binding protein
MMNRFAARVESCDRHDSHAWLRLRGGRLAARLWPGIRPGARLAVRIRPEDVLLGADPPGRVSARNVLPGHVVRIRSVPEGVLVTVDAGIALTALVTRDAAADLRLRKGMPVFALVKATAVEPEERVRARFRVAIEGIGIERLDFLRAVAREGSLSAAARERGISFRTAWAWIGALNRVWGTAVVTRVRGGTGGGGASLTPRGRALLGEVARRESALAGLRGF